MINTKSIERIIYSALFVTVFSLLTYSSSQETEVFADTIICPATGVSCTVDFNGIIITSERGKSRGDVEMALNNNN